MEHDVHFPIDVDLSHSPGHALGPQSQVISLDISSGRTQRQRKYGCPKVPVPIHKIPRKRQRNKPASGLGQYPVSNQDVHQGDAVNSRRATSDEKVLLSTTVYHQPRIQGAGRDSNDLLQDLDNLVHKWKAEMQQIDVGKVSNGTLEVDQNLTAVPASADISSTLPNAGITVSEEQKKTDEELHPDISYRPEILENRSNIAAERSGHSFNEAEVKRVDKNATGPIMQHGPAVFEPPRSAGPPLPSMIAKSLIQPNAVLQPLRMMIAPMQSIYEQQIKGSQSPFAKEMDFSTSSIWQRDIPSSSSFRSHTGTHPTSTNTYQLDRYPL